MKCYYTIDPKTLKKVFIPMCWGTIHSMDIEDCNCENPLTQHYFEKERFNKIVEDKNKTIISQQNEIKHLNQIIKSFKNKNHENR
jgi:hypothetical protein